MHFAIRSRLFALAAFALGLDACGGGNMTATNNPAAVPVNTFTGLQSATSTVCVKPTASPQAVPLPATGNVTGEIDFGPFDASASGCYTVILSTGSAAALTSTKRSTRDQGAAPKPIITITVGDAFPNALPFTGHDGTVVLVTNLKLDAPDLRFRDGVYQATVDTPLAGQNLLGEYFVPTTLRFVAKNGVLSLDLSNQNYGVPNVVHAMDVIRIYDRDVPAPSPTPAIPGAGSGSGTAAPSPSPSPSPSPTPSPSSLPLPSPSAYPTSPVASPTGTFASPAPSPSGATVILHEDAFVPSCSTGNNQCGSIASIQRLDMTGDSSSFDLNYDVVQSDGYRYTADAYFYISNIRATGGIQVTRQSGLRDLIYVNGQAVSTNTSNCSSTLSGCVITVYFASSDRQQEFETNFAAYRQARGF